MEIIQKSYQGYALKKQIGKGSFGNIYLVERQSKFYAMKQEAKNEIKQMLEIQCNVLRLMAGSQGYPKIYEYIQQQDKCILIMQLLDKSLEDLFKEHNNKFDISTCLLIMKQILKRLQDLHKKNYLYRDIKPSNFMISNETKNKIINIIDFGLCKKYKNNKQIHIPLKQNKKLVGTPLFCSINTHLGYEQSRRDDLQGLLYMIIYFLKPLPWQNILEQNKQQKYEYIKQIKMNTSAEKLCQNLPNQLLVYLKYVKNLKFEEEPDYKYLQTLLYWLEALKNIKPEVKDFEWIKADKKDPKKEIKFNFVIKNKKIPNTINNIEILKTSENLFEKIVEVKNQQK